jgi:general secretion pathway protein B
MSYLLEALRKADAERNLGRVPDLQTAPADSRPARRRLWPWLAGLMLALTANVVVLIVVFQPRLFQRSEPAASPAPAPPAVPAVPSPAGTGAAPQTQPMLAAPSPPALSAIPVAPPVAPTVPRDPPPVVPDPALPTVEEWQTFSPSTAPPLGNAASLPASPSAAAPAPGTDPEPLTDLPALPAELQGSLPRLNLDVHVYSPAAGKRFVLINARRYQEGEQLNEGPRLEAITAEGAVLSYRGQRFILPVYR